MTIILLFKNATPSDLDLLIFTIHEGSNAHDLFLFLSRYNPPQLCGEGLIGSVYANQQIKFWRNLYRWYLGIQLLFSYI